MNKKITYYLFFYLLLSFSYVGFSSCKKDEQKKADTTTTTDDTKIDFSIDSSIDLSTKEGVLKDYKDNYLPTNTEDSGWTGSVEGCNSGDIDKEVRVKAMKRWMYYRRQVGYKNFMVFDPSLNKAAQGAALVMKANNTLSHDITDKFTCFTEEAKKGALGNLHLIIATYVPKNVVTGAIDAFIKDAGANNTQVGHRVWLLHPNIQSTSVGATNTSTVTFWQREELIKPGGPREMPNGKPTFSWPPEGHVIADLVYPRWSFHYLTNTVAGASVDVEQAMVSMKNVLNSDRTVSIKIASRYNVGKAGVAVVVWEPTLNRDESKDNAYDVTISNVMVSGVAKTFTYRVNIIPTP